MKEGDGMRHIHHMRGVGQHPHLEGGENTVRFGHELFQRRKIFRRRMGFGFGMDDGLDFDLNVVLT